MTPTKGHEASTGASILLSLRVVALLSRILLRTSKLRTHGSMHPYTTKQSPLNERVAGTCHSLSSLFMSAAGGNEWAMRNPHPPIFKA